MTTPADNTVDTAPTQETQIPKWRLDEISARLRAREEELAIKDQLLNQLAPRNQQPTGLTAEDVGLEAQTFQAVQKIAAHMAQQQVAQISNPVKHQLATVANQLEETQFLLNHGKDKAKYLEKIKAQRQRHYQSTGSYLSVDDAYKLVMFDEMTRQTTSRQAAPVENVQQAPTVTTEQVQMGGPDTNQTRQPGAGGTTKAKTLEEMSIEELEAHIDSGLGGTFI